MNCPTAAKLSHYVDNLLTEQELVLVQSHLTRCTGCKHVIEAFRQEQEFLKETLQTPTLPDNFASLVLDQLDPYEPEVFPKKRTPWKRIMLSAAGIILVVGLSTSLNPGFAQWIGGLFSTDQVDEGLRMATENGLAQRVNLEVQDQGLTFIVEDVIADSSRVALSYQILNNEGKAQDSQLYLGESKNDVYAVDQNGKRLDKLTAGTAWSEGSDYGLIEFSLKEYDSLENFVVKLDLVELDGVKGNWKLEIPVDLTESRKLTTIIPLKDSNTIQHGVNIQMKEVQHSPSSDELLYETSLTKEEQSRLEEKLGVIRKKFGRESVEFFDSYGPALQYHIENEEKKPVYHRDAWFVKPEESVLQLLSSSGSPLGEFGRSAWNESFVPTKDEGKLTFVLDGIIKTEPADFSIKINPKELRNKPVSFEYEGNFMTIKEAKKDSKYSFQKSLIPVKREKIFKIEMEGGMETTAATELREWALEDGKGKTYLVYPSGSILYEKDEHGRYKTSIELISYDMDEVPEELTLHLLSVKRIYPVKDEWRVPLY
ncbi:DUF4179 domain-containing protein [Bacillus sp. T33-2]|uniref:DUF4179 domain-containing protein n=1 Tax=Bacillus sp. T33-2 TaxID=2054168 RepID=UPI000C7826D8|nr:DUF4179 domain-containing protein [Bacillus sp. T33-2]PLR92538.1 hypothetical protein CVD19_19955 [Bacillus sp. T33-2]